MNKIAAAVGQGQEKVIQSASRATASCPRRKTYGDIFSYFLTADSIHTHTVDMPLAYCRGKKVGGLL